MQSSSEKKAVRTYRDLNVYQLAYELAMEIFEVTKNFPRDEIYSLTDQIRRSSRSIPVNLAEGWAKRKYRNVFLRHLIDAVGSCEETKVWVGFARDCKYVGTEQSLDLINRYNQVGAMLSSLMKKWEAF